jgi:hypothetical protein
MSRDFAREAGRRLGLPVELVVGGFMGLQLAARIPTAQSTELSGEYQTFPYIGNGLRATDAKPPALSVGLGSQALSAVFVNSLFGQRYVAADG